MPVPADSIRDMLKDTILEREDKMLVNGQSATFL